MLPLHLRLQPQNGAIHNLNLLGSHCAGLGQSWPHDGAGPASSQAWDELRSHGWALLPIPMLGLLGGEHLQRCWPMHRLHRSRAGGHERGTHGVQQTLRAPTRTLPVPEAPSSEQRVLGSSASPGEQAGAGGTHGGPHGFPSATGLEMGRAGVPWCCCCPGGRCWWALGAVGAGTGVVPPGAGLLLELHCWKALLLLWLEGQWHRGISRILHREAPGSWCCAWRGHTGLTPEGSKEEEWAGVAGRGTVLSLPTPGAVLNLGSLVLAELTPCSVMKVPAAPSM